MMPSPPSPLSPSLMTIFHPSVVRPCPRPAADTFFRFLSLSLSFVRVPALFPWEAGGGSDSLGSGRVKVELNHPKVRDSEEREKENIPSSDFPTECRVVASLDRDRRAGRLVGAAKPETTSRAERAARRRHCTAWRRPLVRLRPIDILICILSGFGNRIVTFGEKEREEEEEDCVTFYHLFPLLLFSAPSPSLPLVLLAAFLTHFLSPPASVFDVNEEEE